MDTKKQEEPFISPSGVFVATETAIANFVPDCNENSELVSSEAMH